MIFNSTEIFFEDATESAFLKVFVTDGVSVAKEVPPTKEAFPVDVKLLKNVGIDRYMTALIAVGTAVKEQVTVAYSPLLSFETI